MVKSDETLIQLELQLTELKELGEVLIESFKRAEKAKYRYEKEKQDYRDFIRMGYEQGFVTKVEAIAALDELNSLIKSINDKAK